MSSVAKCLVLATAALEADALLLRTQEGQQATTKLCTKGCSDNKPDEGKGGAAAASICAAAKAVEDSGNTKLKVSFGKDKKKGSFKLGATEYSCDAKKCSKAGEKGSEKFDGKEGTGDSAVDVNEGYFDAKTEKGDDGADDVKKACAGDEKKADAKKAPEGATGDMCTLAMQLADAKTTAITKVANTVEGDASKATIAITWETKADPITYTCKDFPKCDKKTGTAGDGDVTATWTTNEIDPDHLGGEPKILKDAVKTECTKGQ